jgi:hypothetical protein
VYWEGEEREEIMRVRRGEVVEDFQKLTSEIEALLTAADVSKVFYILVLSSFVVLRADGYLRDFWTIGIAAGHIGDERNIGMGHRFENEISRRGPFTFVLNISFLVSFFS